MKTISKIIYAFILAFVSFFISCEGPAGADGKDGIDGKDGNANVIASQWISPEWSATDTTFAEFFYNDEKITEEILNSGLLISYVDWYGDLSQVHSLPLTYVYSGYDINYNVTSLIGKIRWWFLTQYASYTPPSDMRFRYIIIPSNSSDKSANPQQEILYSLDKAGVDVNNYYDVCAYFGIKP